MPYKRHQPVELKEMEKTRWHGHHTICQFLRDIYQLTEDNDIKMKCRVGMSMAKSMNERLKYYKNKEINNADNTH